MDECYACVVGVATGPRSHSEGCPARDIPMPVQDGQWGPEWDEYDRRQSSLSRGDDLERLRAASQDARQAAARIDAAFSHGVPSGSEDPVTEADWHALLRYARGEL